MVIFEWGILKSGSNSAKGIKTNFLIPNMGWGIANSFVSNTESPWNKISTSMIRGAFFSFTPNGPKFF